MQPRWKAGEFAQDARGPALQGYDPVAFFTEGQAVPGLPEWEATWSQARWRFASAAHREAFLAAPQQYAPQCGGYCAFAVSFSARPSAPAAPAGVARYWTLADGKLFLNANWFAHVLFRLGGRAERALAVWRSLAA